MSSVPTAADLPASNLYYREGAADKVYQAWIEAKDAGFTVNFAFGRRGNALSTGTKTSSPVSYQTATKIYEKLVAEKKSKGYTPEESGQAFAMTEKAGRISGRLPQLLNPLDETGVSTYLDSTSVLILATIAEEPRHGYAIAREIARQSDALITLGEGSLYPALLALEREGLIVGEWQTPPPGGGPARKVYSLTDAGQAELTRRSREVRALA